MKKIRKIYIVQLDKDTINIIFYRGRKSHYFKAIKGSKRYSIIGRVLTLLREKKVLDFSVELALSSFNITIFRVKYND